MTRNDSITYRIVDEYQTPSAARFNWLLGNTTLTGAGFSEAQAQAAFPYFWGRWQALGRTAADFNLLTCMTAAISDAIWSAHAAAYTATCQSRANIIVPPGRYKINYPLPIHFGSLEGHGSSEFYTNGSDYGGSFGQGGTSFWKDRARWLGVGAEQMNVFQSGTWGDPNLFGYNEAFQFTNFRVVGDSVITDYDAAQADAGMAVWDMGSNAQIDNVFADDFQGEGFHFVRGTYVNCGQIASFRNLRAAVFCQGGGQFRISSLEQDECPSAFRVEAGYDRPGSASLHCDWLKMETGPAPSRPVGKGSMVLDGHGWINASFDHIQFASVNQMPHCMFRVNADMDNSNTLNDNSCSVHVNSLVLFGPCYNLFHDVFNRKLWRMHAPGGQSNKNGYWGTQVKDFKWISHGGGGRLVSTFYQPVVLTNVHPGRREPLPIDNMTGNMIGTWNDTTGTPAYTFCPQAGPISNPPATTPETPFAANAIITIGAPVINVGQTSQATVAVTDQFGANFPSTGGVWNVVSGNGNINSAGLITGTGPGTITVSFTLGGSSWFNQVTVNSTAPPVQTATTVNVTLPAATLQVGQQMQAQYQVLDQNGAAMSATGLWSIVTGGAFASVNANTGVIIAANAGTVVVRFQTGGPSGPSGTANLTITDAPVVSDPTTVTVTLPQSVLQSGSTMQATVAVLDQNGQPMSAAGTWSIVSTPAFATVSPTGLITGTGAGNVTVRFTVTDGPSGQASFLGTVVVVPPTPTPLFDLTFLGQNPANLPGMVPVTQEWKRGTINGATMTTTINTIQKHAAPIAGVRRIVLTGLTMKENAQDKWLNNRVRTNATRQFILDTVAATAQDPVISPAFTVGVEGNITITFATPQTITHLFGGSDTTYYTSLLGVKRIQYWSTP